ncbi:ASPSCR1 [Scenedesmus sp. PABB004]|nr:ASPSCR1 [Scenedesmus sp. PABB004]
MTTLTLSWFGPPEQKHAVKVTAMQTLADVLAGAAGKFRPPLAPGGVSLSLRGKALDLATPFRLLNVPAGSKLEITRKPGGAAPGAPSQAAAAVPAEALAAVQAPPAAAAAAADAAAAPPAAKQVAFAQPEPPAPAALPAGAASGGAGAAAGSSSAAAAGAVAAAAAPEPSADVPPALAALGVRVPVVVFHQRALEAAAAAAPSPMAVDLPDEFFELTPDDLAMLQHNANAKKKAEAVFRTRASREAEGAARAARLGPVRVRLHFPDGTLLQAQFRATDTLGDVQALVSAVAAPGLAPALQLYTTPPKVVLRDGAATLYALQLVPAAHIHVGLDAARLPPGVAAPGAGAPLLRAEVQALMQEGVPAAAAPPPPRPRRRRATLTARAARRRWQTRSARCAPQRRQAGRAAAAPAAVVQAASARMLPLSRSRTARCPAVSPAGRHCPARPRQRRGAAPCGAAPPQQEQREQQQEQQEQQQQEPQQQQEQPQQQPLGAAPPPPAQQQPQPQQGLVTLEEVQAIAAARGLHLSLKTLGPFYRITLRDGGAAGRVLGTTDGFVAPAFGLMHCDTLQVFARGSAAGEGGRGGGSPLGLGLLLGGAVFAHGRACGCAKAEILAINDDDAWHERLVRYYAFFGFKPVRRVGGNGFFADLPHLLVWGGEGTRMDAAVDETLAKWTRALRQQGTRRGAARRGGGAAEGRGGGGGGGGEG